MSTNRLRVAWFTDTGSSGIETVSAYTSALLLPELARYHDVEVFTDTTAASNFGLQSSHYLTAHRKHQRAPFDIFFYQLEDSKTCRFVRGHIGLVPGVTWLHDLFYNDLGPEAFHTSPWETSIAQYHDPSVAFYDRAKAPHQLWPRAYRETSLSPVVLFSSPWARNEYRRMVSARVEGLSGEHPAEVLPIPVSVETGARSRTEDVLRIASASVTGIEGRMHKVLPALRGLSMPWALAWMVAPEEAPAARELVEEFGVSSSVRIVAGRTAETWRSILAESDVALHLHASVFGRLAPFAQISLSMGVPTVVSFAAQGEDFPESAVLHVVPGSHEGRQIREIAEAIARRGSVVCGANGRRFALAANDPSKIAETVASLLTEWAPHVAYVMDRWERLRQRGQRALLDEVRVLVDKDDQSSMNPFRRVLSDPLRELGWMK
ncbi:MAG: hypothetical protein RL326_1882 [Pseudomonadota bacterium]|jgi:hypothetical protein